MPHHPPAQGASSEFLTFQIGGFRATVVNDGDLALGTAQQNFPSVDADDLAVLVAEHDVDPQSIVMQQNVLLVDTGSSVVLFDAGVGADPDYGRAIFGEGVGHLVERLQHAGYQPDDIDIIAISHTHPDHVWGLVDEDGRALFPNAVLAITRDDVDYWTQLDNAVPENLAHFTGTIKSLAPYLDANRVRWVTDGMEVAPGVHTIATPGHSPGHTIYRIESQGEALIFWGDICHHPLLLRRPEWAFQFDHDAESASAQRRRVYEYVAGEDLLVLAYHFRFPGVGRVRRDDTAFRWEPLRPGISQTASSAGDR